MYPIFRKPRSGRLPTTAEHPSQNNHIASQRSVTTSADDEGVEWLRPVYSTAKRSQVCGLMCSTRNNIRFYDRDVSAALNIRRCAVGPRPRPTELCYWEGSLAMPKPGQPGQEWVYLRDKALLPHKAPKDLAALQRCEQSVIEAIDAAGHAMQELSRLETGLDTQRLQQCCQEFMKHVKASKPQVVPIEDCSMALLTQDLVKKAVSTPASGRDFQATVYQSMVKAHVASEKVGIVSLQIDAMQALLSSHVKQEK
ncbi:hypothetical protein QJQ45_004350 [Haematococcus lacustris]|nr:hypothetical protein QJQ45_004350 [Haematococcus lacustris]